MTEVPGSFRSEYRAAFATYLVGNDEAGLRAAYELGRTAMLGGLSVLDLAEIHHDVLFGTLETAEVPVTHRAASEAGSTFLLEVLAPYEMVQRGFAEAHQTARLEQQHAAQLRRLAAASVAINAAGALDDIARRIPEHAVGVIEAASATLTLRSSRSGPPLHTYPADAQPPASGARTLSGELVRRNGSSLGQLEVVAAAGQSFSGNDEAMLTQLAQLAGVAMENAELYEQERLVAETLQRRLLPGSLPSFPGVTMAWRYLPGWGGSDIGGDWYDAMTLPGARLAIVVGDVMGKGIRAAAGMGQVRIALRAYAIEGHPPGVVIQRLDQILEELEEELTTVVYLVYEPSTGTLRYANAGHPPPLLVAPGGSSRLLRGALSPPLGSMIGAECRDERVAVEQGSTLVVYSDGLVERRDSDIECGLRRLQDAAASGDPADLEAFCDRLLEGMDADRRGDDIAMLAARFDALPAPAATRER